MDTLYPNVEKWVKIENLTECPTDRTDRLIDEGREGGAGGS